MIKTFSEALLVTLVSAQAQSIDYEADTMRMVNSKFDLAGSAFAGLSNFEQGSNLEQARLVAQTLPISDKVMNDKVRATYPTPEETFQWSQDGRYVRRIYGGIDLTEQEREMIDGFRRWLSDQGLSIPNGYLDKQNYALRYLNSTKGDYQTAYDFILRKESWLVDDLIPNLNDINAHAETLQAGGYYAYGRDKNMRPIVIQRIRNLVDSGIGGSNFIPVNDAVLGYTVMNAMIPGQIEQFFMIIDAGNLRVWEIPLKQIMSFVQHASTAYRHRVYKIYVINLPWIVRKAINFVYNFLDDFQKQQLTYFGDDYHSDLLEHIDADNLEERYGGKLPNLQKGDYWPPQLNV